MNLRNNKETIYKAIKITKKEVIKVIIMALEKKGQTRKTGINTLV